METTVQNAVLAAQERSMRTRSSHQLDLLDLALDELVRHPSRVGDPTAILDSALANARKHVSRRSDLAPSRSYEELIEHKGDVLGDARAGRDQAAEILVIDTADELGRSALSSRDKGLLLLAALGYDAHGIAEFAGLAPQRASEQLSRARRAARDGLTK